MEITGKIDQAMPSKSGKTLRVSINNVWYSTKAFELQNMVGQTITGNTSVSVLPDGAQMQWLNDYVPGAGQVPPAPPVTADQAFQAAMQQPVPPAANVYAQQAGAQPVPPTPQPITDIDRNASITAQSLTKCCTAPGDDLAKVWATYTRLYALYAAWDGTPVPWPTHGKVHHTEKVADGYTADKVGITIPGGATGDGDYDDDIPF